MNCCTCSPALAVSPSVYLLGARRPFGEADPELDAALDDGDTDVVARFVISGSQGAADARVAPASRKELPAALRDAFCRAIDQFITDDERQARIQAAVTDDLAIDYFIEMVERGASRFDLYQFLLAMTGEPDDLLTRALTDRSRSRSRD